MQVRINRKPMPDLPPRLERQLIRKRGPEAVEGQVLDAPAALRAASRSMLGMIVMVAIFTLMVNLVALSEIGARRPQNLKAAIPVMLLPIAFVAVVMALIHRHRMRRTRERLDEVLDRMPPAGAVVRVDAQGLGIDGRTTAWSRLSIEAVDIARTSSGDSGDSFSIDTLVMRDDRGREIVLDFVALTQGRKLVDFVWRSLRPRP